MTMRREGAAGAHRSVEHAAAAKEELMRLIDPHDAFPKRHDALTRLPEENGGRRADTEQLTEVAPMPAVSGGRQRSNFLLERIRRKRRANHSPAEP
jgi:hypothetical protein